MASQLEREIHEQPEAIARLLSHGRDTAERIAGAIERHGPKYVVIAARGSSANAAQYARYALGARNGLTVAMAAPSLATIYDAVPSMEGALVVGISQSGRSPDLVAVLDEARRQGALTLALTNTSDCPLMHAASHTLLLDAGEELSVAATKTYTAELMAVAMLSTALRKETKSWDELASIPDKMRDALRLNGDMASKVAPFQSAPYMVVLGRGFNQATAFEIALKVKETSYLAADSYSSADFLHGPVAMVDRGVPVVVVAPKQGVLGDVADVIPLVQARGADLLAISEREDVLRAARVGLPLPEGVPEWLSPMVAVIPGQLFALDLALSRGTDPDSPRGLSKITKTR